MNLWWTLSVYLTISQPMETLNNIFRLHLQVSDWVLQWHGSKFRKYRKDYNEVLLLNSVFQLLDSPPHSHTKLHVPLPSYFTHVLLLPLSVCLSPLSFFKNFLSLFYKATSSHVLNFIFYVMYLGYLCVSFFSKII